MSYQPPARSVWIKEETTRTKDRFGDMTFTLRWRPIYDGNQ